MNAEPMRPAGQAGFALLEVLIAVLILSIGILGLAGLQVVGLKEGQTSYQRSQAILLAYEIADRMRANRGAATDGWYAVTSGTAPAAPGVTCTGTATCTPPQMAAYDIYTWYQRVQATLAAGTASISCTSGCYPGRKQTVVVQWDETRSGSAGSGCSTDTLSRDGCIAVNVVP